MLYQLWHQCLFLWTSLCVSTSRSVAEQNSMLIYGSEHFSEIAIISKHVQNAYATFFTRRLTLGSAWLIEGRGQMWYHSQSWLEKGADDLKQCNRKRIGLKSENWVSLLYLLVNLYGWSQFNIATCYNIRNTKQITFTGILQIKSQSPHSIAYYTLNSR